MEIIKRDVFESGLPWKTSSLMDLHPGADFVIGCTGSSLERVDLRELCKDKIVIGVNGFIRFWPSDYAVMIDPNAWKDWGRMTMRNPSVTPLLSELIDHRHPYHVLPYNPSTDYDEGFSDDTIYHGREVGIVAVNIAIKMGARRIYIAGMDGIQAGVQKYAHDSQVPDADHSIHVTPCLVAIRRELEKQGREIYLVEGQESIHRGVLLPAYPEKQTRKRIQKQRQKPIYISYFTEGTGYETEAMKLQKSLEAFGLPHKIYPMPNLYNWRLNCAQKVPVILAAIREHKRPVVWLDADAVVRKHPVELENVTDDVAVCMFAEYNELGSGTMYFDFNGRVIALLKTWMKECGRRPAELEQIVLQNMLFGTFPKNWIPPKKHDNTPPGKIEGLKIKLLGQEYNRIFDHRKMKNIKPVIEQFQASRKLRSKIETGKPVIGKSIAVEAPRPEPVIQSRGTNGTCHIYGTGPGLNGAKIQHPAIGWNWAICKYDLDVVVILDGNVIFDPWQFYRKDPEKLKSHEDLRDAIRASKALLIHRPAENWREPQQVFAPALGANREQWKTDDNYLLTDGSSAIATICYAIKQGYTHLHIYGMDFAGDHFDGSECAKQDKLDESKKVAVRAIREMLKVFPEVKIENHSQYLPTEELYRMLEAV